MSRLAAALIVAVIGFAVAIPRAPAAIEDEGEALDRVERYLNQMTTVAARFTQHNPDGTTSDGAFYLKRPQFARIEYDEPATIMVARGQKYMLWDAEIGQFYEGPVSASPASVLLESDIRFGDQVEVLETGRTDGLLFVTVRDKDEPGAGIVSLVFKEDPLELNSWYVQDAQGALTRVVLEKAEFGVELDSDFFDLDVNEMIRPN